MAATVPRAGRARVRFEGSANDQIAHAVDQLIDCLGVKEEVPSGELLALLRSRDTERCVQQIASRLGLPVKISLSYVSKHFTPGDASRFDSHDLARTDWTGRGIEEITAQVGIPQCLPMYGTSGLQGYPIQVRVSESCHEHAPTFIAMMAHELSHVLLESLRDPQKDNELYTDLVPIVLGFRAIVQRGRKTVESTSNGSATTTRTTTYGYLSDSQFTFACDRVRAVIASHQDARKRLLTQAAQLRRQLCKVTRCLTLFRDDLLYLDSRISRSMRAKHRPRRRMSGEDASKLVQFHTSHYTREWETAIAQGRTTLQQAEAFVQHAAQYTSRSLQQLQDYIGRLDSTSEHLAQLDKAIAGDSRIVRKYAGLLYRLRSALSPRLARD